MIDIYANFNEALAKLKEASASKYDEVTNKLTTIKSIEAKLNCVTEAIANVATIPDESDRSFTALVSRTEQEFAEAKRDCGVLFGIESRTAQTVKETVAPIKKHNGSVESFVEGNPYNLLEGRTAVDTAANSTRKDRFAGGDAILIEHMTHPVTKQPLTEAEKSKALGGKPAAYANLTAQMKKDYDFARLIGLNESDALKVATI
jgi:hypothetical protein